MPKDEDPEIIDLPIICPECENTFLIEFYPCGVKEVEAACLPTCCCFCRYEFGEWGFEEVRFV